MCTLIALHRRVAGAPLVIAANRDEYLDRPSEGPALRRPDGGRRAVVSPLDLRAGGTWLGLSARGVFAAVTNRPCPEPDPTRRSRGEVVSEALETERAELAAERFEALPRATYNPFNAFVADGKRAFAMVYEDVPQVKELAPGVHVIGNADPNAVEVPKIRRVMERAEAAACHKADAVLAQLAEVCRSHESGPASLGDACVHLGGYGTRSSTLLRVGDDANDSRLLFSDGPPCQSSYEDFTPLLAELSRHASYGPGEFATRKAS